MYMLHIEALLAALQHAANLKQLFCSSVCSLMMGNKAQKM